ncbi:MAG: hypothetical protein JKY65_32345, partial [Planctomycetes bacterium]|nr:hypothetical protein [Planctomycetota bacterium]
MRVRTYAFALCMLVLSPAWADPQVPEGFGQREHTLGPAWVYTPGRELVRLSESQSRLSANSWLLAKLSPYEGLTLLGGRGKVEVYQLRVVGAQSGPSDQETLPPLGLALLGSQLATRHLAGGREGLRIEVGLRPSAGWIGVRAREACQVRLVGLRPEPVPESWERWTRRIRAASDPQDPWPARLANPHSVLLGHGVEEFMSAQQVMLPWAPSEDDAAARSVRVGALLLGSLTVRPLVGGHFHTQPWPKPETPTFLERFGKRGRRAYALADTPQERTVTGPAVVRLWIRGTWSHQDATEDHTLRLRITLDGRDRFEQLIPQVDLGASTTLREDAATSAALAARNLKQVLLSTPQEVRVTIPPGDHELSVAPITSNTWLAVESATRIEQLEQPRALSYLDVPLGEGERSRVLMALVHDLLGEPVAAAAALRALLKGQAPRVRVWAALRLLKLGREAGLPEGLDRARQLLEESLKAPKPLPRLLAPALKELVADAIATKRAIPPAWIEALLKAPLLTPTDLALAHAALAASPGIAGQRVFALPSLVGEGGQLRRLFVATAAQRTHHGRFALLPRLGGGLPSRRFVQPLEIAPGGPETSPSVAWDWKSALGKTGRAYLRIQPPTTELILNGDGPLELLAVDAERPAEWVIERGQRTLTPGALPSSRPLLLDLPAGKIRLRGEPNTAPLLAAGGFRPTDGEWCRVLDLEPLPRSLRREEPDARYQLSSSTWPGVARLRIGVSRADPGAFVDQLFELAVEGRAEPLRFRFVLIPAPGSVTRTSVGQASFVVPPGSARVLLTAPGRPKGLELFASLDEQVYRRPALETTQRRARWLPPPELLELLEGPLDYRDHSKLRQITLRIERLPGSRVDERIALLERRVRILVKLDDLSAARRDLLAALESLRTLARSERRDEARLRLNLAAATLAWETGSRLRLRYHLGELESAAGETLDLLRAALAEAIGSPREARAYLERAALQRGERPPTDLEHVVAAGLG